MSTTAKMIEALRKIETIVTMKVNDVRTFVSKEDSDRLHELREATGYRYDLCDGLLPLDSADYAHAPEAWASLVARHPHLS